MSSNKDRRLLYLKLSAITALIYQIVNIIYGLILPNLYLTHYGSEVNGLVSSIAQYLGLISFCELGIGAVVQSALYKPLENGDNGAVSCIVNEAKSFFRKIAILLCAYVIVLLFLFPMVINKSLGIFTTCFLIIAIAINTFSEYYFGLTNQILLNADQKQYINYCIQIICTVITAIVAIILINSGVRIEYVKLVTSLTLMIRPIFLALYVKKYYRIDSKAVSKKSLLTQKKSGIVHHIAYVIVDRTDVVVLSLMSTLTNVSIYYVYYMVVSGIRQVVVYTTSGIEAFLGHELATEDKQSVNATFSYVEWGIHTCCTLIFSIAAVLILPFVNVYTRNITDAEYCIPMFAYLMVAAQYMYCVRLPYYMMIKADGAYTQTRNSAAIEAILNVVLSVVLVKHLGLVGVAIGTLCAMAYRTLYFVIFLRKYILNRTITIFIRQLLIDIFLISVIHISTLWCRLSSISFYSWILMAIQVSIIALVVCLIINGILCRKYCLSFANMIKKRFHRKMKA